MASSKSNPFTAGTIGKADTGSRGKAESASNRANSDVKQDETAQENWPVGSAGTPMVKAEMAASELIPTGQYANVTVGPCRLHFLIDPDRKLADGETYFSPEQRATIAAALNEAAEIVEGDVVAVQRNLVMENLQDQVSA